MIPHSRSSTGNPTGSSDRPSGAQRFFDPLDDPSSDEWYLDFIKRYENDPMYDELLQNPWLRSKNKDFEPNFLQNIAEGLGFYDSRVAYYEDLLQQRNQVLFDWIAQRNQRLQDSPVEQAKRMALAGQNADLLGTGGVASTPENDQPNQLVDMRRAGQGVREMFDFTFQVAQTGISLISQVMSFAQGVQGLKYGNAQLVAQELDNGSSAMDFLNQEMINTLGVSDISDIEKIDSAVYIRSLDNILNDKSLSTGTRRMLKRYRDTLQSDTGTGLLHTMKMELAERYANAKKGTAGIVSDPLYDKDFEKWIGNLSEYFNDYVLKAQKLALKAEQSQNKYTKEYYDKLDSSKASDYENVSYDANKIAAENTQMVDELYNQIYKYLKSDDHWYSKLGLAFLPALRAYIMNMSLPSLNFSRPQTTNNNNYINNNDNRGVDHITNIRN